MSAKLDCVALAVILGGEMLRYGGETYRAEECCTAVLKAYGADNISVLSFPTALLVGADCNGENRTESVNVKDRSINLKGIAAINALSRRIARNKMSVDEAFEEIERIKNRSDNFWRLALFAALSAGFFALVFDGGLVDFVPAFIASIVAQLFKQITDKVSRNSFISTIGGCMITAGFARFTVWVFPACSMDAVIVGGIMSMLPGLAITNALRDTIHGDTVSGVARGVEALITGVAIAAGVAIVLAM